MDKDNTKNRQPRRSKGGKSKKKFDKSKISKSDVRDVTHANDSATDLRVHNDPTWYFKDPVMKQGLTRMPTMEFLGKDISIKDVMNFSGSGFTCDVDARIASPTLAVYEMNPSPGISNKITSAINQASRKLYSQLSASNAKTANYAPQDITTLILQLGEIISLINYCTRAYGIGTFYNRFNRAVPTVFLRAMRFGSSPADWARQMPDFRAKLNQIITIANSISFPSNISYFDKCAYIYQNIFLDSTDPMSPMHMMVPYSTWKIDETYTEGTKLKTVALVGANASPDVVLTRLGEIVNEVLTSLTYNYIYSDIINLANRGVLNQSMLHFDTIPVDYAISPIYSDQFNWQITNASIIGAPAADLDFYGHTYSNDVLPDVDNNMIRYIPGFNISWNNDRDYEANVVEPIIRVPQIDISEDDLIELLVYTSSPDITVYSVDTTETGNLALDAEVEYETCDLPDHYVVEVQVFNGDVSHRHTLTSNTLNTSDISYSLLHVLGICSEFKHFPLMLGASLDKTGDNKCEFNTHFILGELGNYTTDIRKALGNIRYASYLGLFNVE